MSAKQIAGYTVYTSQILGRGSFGNVCRGIKDDTGERLAVKIIPKYRIEENQYLSASLNNEINILRQVNSENIVRFHELKETNNNYYIIQELCDGDLGSKMRPGGQMKESFCIDVLTQLCTGFYQLVRHNITHRDLKPANILISGNKFKLADFGFSKKLAAPNNEENMKMITYVGTPLYMAPEILLAKPYTNKCDIWALGFIFYEMLHGITPWVGAREYELVENIKNQPLVIRRKDLSDETVDFLARSLKINEDHRISWPEIFQHPIFKGYFREMENREQGEYFEMTMKGIMVKLRQCFNLNKYSLEEFLNQYGFKNKQEDLTFDRYFQFLKLVYKDITEEEAIFIFKRTDIDNSGTISVEEIVQMLKEYGFDDPMAESQDISEASQAAWERMKEVFIKLHKVIERNHLSLEKVFRDFSKDKPSMRFSEFKTMVQKMCKNISDQQAKLAFREIDEDDSDSLEFEELKKYYQSINNL